MYQTLITRSSEMKAIIKRFVRNDSGATAIEYGLIAAGISVVIIAAVQATGANLTGTFQTVSNALK
jgi:pilus assembly protein Flp/PilA